MNLQMQWLLVILLGEVEWLGLITMLLNSAYTMGIIGSIAVEEVVLAAAAGIQVGFNPVSDAMFLSASARNLARLKRAGSAMA
jgi:cytosine/adenosine deaminase-related metal-dependent hydrolase